MSNSRPVSINLYDMANGAVSGTVQYIFRGAIEGNFVHPPGTISVSVTNGTATTNLLTSAIGNSFPYDLVVADGLDYSFLLPYGDGGTVNVATLITSTNNPPAQSLYEPQLGSPGTSGHVLSSTPAGVRSWIAPSGGGAVDSVFSRTGAVVAEAGDYAASQITDDSTMAKASVAAALNTLDASVTDLQTTKQDADADLAAIAALTPSNDDVIQRKAGAWTNRTMAQLLSDLSTKLNAINALTWAANSIILLTGTATASVQALAAHVIAFLQSASAADARTAIGAGTGSGDLLAANNLSELTATQSTARTNLGLGTLATQSGTFSGGGTLATGGFNLTVPATGTAALLATANTFTAHNLFQITDAVTNAATIGITLEHQSSGTPAANFGTSIKFLLESSTTVGQDAALIETRWANATHAIRVGVLELSAYYVGTKTSLQVYPSTTDTYARLVWGSNSDQGLWRESNEQVISGASVGFKSWNGSAYVFSARFDGNTTAGNTRFLIYDVDNGQIERVSTGAADSGGAGHKVLRIPN